MKLTKQQQDLVVRNHNMIYDFAYKRNLNYEEYYGILAIGLCYASQVFDSSKGKFATIAYKCMENELINYWLRNNRKYCIPENAIIPIDTTKDTDDIYLVNLKDDYCLCDDVLSQIELNSFLSILSCKEKMVMQYLLSGMKQNEIALKMDCTKQNINSIVKRIREKWKEFHLDE